MSSKNRGSAAASKRAARRAPQHRKDAGRHREPSRTVSELTARPATLGVKLAAVGVLGSAAALAVPTLASAASVSPAGSPAPQGPQPLSGVVVTGCGGLCSMSGAYNNGARVIGLGFGTPSGEIAVQYGPPPSQSSMGAVFSVDSAFGARGKLIFDSANGISWQASASANSGGFTIGQTYAPGQGWVWDNTQPSSNYRIGLRDNVMVYYKNVPDQVDPSQPVVTGDGMISYPPDYVPPPAHLNDWSTAFGPSEGGAPLNPPPAAPAAPAAPASADPAPAAPAAAPAVDPFAGAPVAPVYNPVIDTGVGSFSGLGLGAGTDPLSGVSTGITSPLNTGIATNLDTGLTSSVPEVPSIPSVAPIDDPAVSTGDSSFSSMDLATASDPLGGGGFSGGDGS